MSEATHQEFGPETHEATSEELTQGLHALLARMPELVPLLSAAANWLGRVASDAAAKRKTAGQERHGVAEGTRAGLAASVTDGQLAAPSPPRPSETLAAAAPLPPSAAQIEALLAKFAGPPVAPRVERSATPAKPPALAPIGPDDEIAALRRQIGLQLAAITWALNKVKHGFDAVKDTYVHLRERGEEERCFMWALDRSIEGVSTTEVSGIREWYLALGDALDAYGDEDSDLGRTPRSFEHLATVAQATRQAIGVLASLGLRDQGLEDLRHWIGRNARRFDFDAESLPELGKQMFDAGAQSATTALQKLESDARARAAQRRDRQSACNKFLYELKRHLSDPSEREQHVRGMTIALDELHAAGGAANQGAFVKRVNAVLGTASLPASLMEREDGQELALALARLQDDLTDESDDRERPLSESVLRVREALRGKCVVIVGGDERPEHRGAIERAFELSELRWVATRPHESHSNIVPAIIRPDVDLVLLLIRWASHSYGDLRDQCASCDKPFIRLPAGYSPSTIAHEFMQQVGKRFGIES